MATPPLLVGRRNRAYVRPGRDPQIAMIMPDTAISTMPMRLRPAVWVGAGIVGLMLGGTTLLWAHLGSTVFFEMIAAGLAACF
jgi:multidrug transporter EmrE-like cation transporter